MGLQINECAVQSTVAVLSADPQQTQLDVQLVKTLISAWLGFAVHSPKRLLHTVKANSQEGKKIRPLAHCSCSPLCDHLIPSQREVFQTLPFVLRMINLHSHQEQRDLQRALRSARKPKEKNEQRFTSYTIGHGLLVFGRRADSSCARTRRDLAVGTAC